jgi:hypothetical protein
MARSVVAVLLALPPRGGGRQVIALTLLVLVAAWAVLPPGPGEMGPDP